jgi:hypothetical protein
MIAADTAVRLGTDDLASPTDALVAPCGLVLVSNATPALMDTLRQQVIDQSLAVVLLGMENPANEPLWHLQAGGCTLTLPAPTPTNCTLTASHGTALSHAAHWFIQASEQLGDLMRAQARSAQDPLHALLHLLPALDDHEKMLQDLENALLQRIC